MSQTTSVAKIGKYLRYQREKRGLSLNGFAKELKLDPSFLHRVEKGYYQSISLDFAEKIAKGLDMSLEGFLAKCEVVPSRFALPTLEYFFKEQYQFPSAAIDDISLFLEFIQVKYKKQIKALKEKHSAYWKKKKKITSQR